MNMELGLMNQTQNKNILNVLVFTLMSLLFTNLLINYIRLFDESKNGSILSSLNMINEIIIFIPLILGVIFICNSNNVKELKKYVIYNFFTFVASFILKNLMLLCNENLNIIDVLDIFYYVLVVYSIIILPASFFYFLCALIKFLIIIIQNK